MFASSKTAAVVNAIPNYIEDVFSTYLYTGNGSSQTITNGIDLSGKGGMVWIKSRSNAKSNSLFDTERGAYKWLTSNGTNASTNFSPNSLTAFNSNGFSLLDDATSTYAVNGTNYTYASWTFRKQPKFFDVVTYTGNGSNRTIAHALGSVPGCIIVKRTNTTGDWMIYHRSIANTQYYNFAYTGTPATDSTVWNSTTATSSVFSLGTNSNVNASGSTYVAYVFAHDAGGFGLTGTDNVITCGSFTTDGSGNATVNLGYEPQFVMLQRQDDGWFMNDSMRGMPAPPSGSGTNANLFPDSSNAESINGRDTSPTSTGFVARMGSASKFCIYIAIRRGPMKVPTSGTSVFSPVAQAGNGSTQNITTGFTTDLVIGGSRTANPIQGFVDRLRGLLALLPNNTSADDPCPSGRDLTSFASNTGFTLGYPPFATSFNTNGNNIYWNFRRAPSFFDIVCYSGTGTSNSSVNHNLGVVPELFIVKRRNTGGSGDVNWGVYSKDRPSISQNLILNSTTGWYNAGTNGWFGTGTLSSTLFPSGNASANFGNLSGGTYVAYLFATCAGVSKVGSYTGNGSTQTIDCGFTGGARFVMIKATSTTGDWMVADSARGIVSGNDPYLELNNTNAEVTGEDWLDTDSTGFVVNQVSASNANTNGVTYIFLAIA